MKKLVDQIRSFAGLITAITVIAGATIWVNGRTEKGRTAEQSKGFEQVMDTLSVMQDAIWYNNVQISDLNEDVQSIHDTLEKIDDENQEQSEDIETLGWAISRIESFTPEQMEEILSRELKKNYVMESWGIEWPEELTARSPAIPDTLR